MALYNTIHIFGFGTVQVISDDKNVQTAITNVSTEAEGVIDNVWANRPEDYTGTKEYHAVNIFNDLFADWQPSISGEKGFRVPFENLNPLLLASLANAVLSTDNPAPAPNATEPTT